MKTDALVFDTLDAALHLGLLVDAALGLPEPAREDGACVAQRWAEPLPHPSGTRWAYMVDRIEDVIERLREHAELPPVETLDASWFVVVDPRA